MYTVMVFNRHVMLHHTEVHNDIMHSCKPACTISLIYWFDEKLVEKSLT